MIKSFRDKGLQRFFTTGSTAGVQTPHAKRLRMQLAALDTATVIEDMDIPGFSLHPLKGKAKGRWSIRVSGNWRLTFEFKDGNAYVLNYEDYH
ncbi:type II toxin-antitoxin system RelE/ParE family toxin [Alloalcanivorax xenomutans]|uniref:Type II toxin-antitoxin system RelE/ParE family toxin n=1 Tax=Alloalcanivorax xenomutans TaxID=1094342 RepID=A0A9Q3ZGP1_9GAMM|nr:type II toxin-antitoxin system RelE/ParE family toxin [Alloalcanivorax xenomutans]ARB47591.1 Killer protein [Alloalcanivorax xenomutans]MCE7507542.1 type II toxin-antitoxin system RelE/ParE family toxin [Alloalcanivorax xenomutans]